MKQVLCLLLVLCSGQILLAQRPIIFTIQADSIKLTNCDTTELILENHTQGVPGFLFNKGRGRTEFRRLLTSLGGNTWLVGIDTLTLGSSFWAANGTNIYNTNTGNVGIHRQLPVAMFDLPGPINLDDTSSYQIHNIPVLRIGSIDAAGNYSAFSAGPGTGAPNTWAGGTFVGDSAGNVSNGIYNTFVGYKSGTLNQVYNGLSGENTFVGAMSGQNSGGAGNSMVGYNSGNFSQGSYNVALGNYAGYGSNGDDNVYIGDSTGLNIQGDYNTFLGQLAGKGISHSATSLTLVGGQANASQDGLTDATAIGSNAVVASSYTMVFGDANVNTWRFNTNAPTTTGGALVVGYNSTNGNGAYLTKGGVWTNASDRNKKENFEPLNGSEILENIDRLPITSWNYKGTTEKHIGPVAQDFHRLFNVGSDDKTITTIDPSGVALAGIQELYRRWQQSESQVADQDAQIKEATSRLLDQQAQIDELKERLQRRDTDIMQRREQIRQLLEKLR
jgi:hypothetical protein